MSQIRWTNPDGTPVEPQALSVWDVASTVLTGVRDVAIDIGNVVGGLAYLVKAHANYARDRSEFAATVNSTIERI